MDLQVLVVLGCVIANSFCSSSYTDWRQPSTEQYSQWDHQGDIPYKLSHLAARQFSPVELSENMLSVRSRPGSVGSSVAHQSDPLSSRGHQTANMSNHHLTNSSPLPGHQSSPTTDKHLLAGRSSPFANARSSRVQPRFSQVEPSFKERQIHNTPLSTVQQRTFQFEPSLKGRQLPNATLSTVQQRTFQVEPSFKERQLPNAPLSTVQQRTFQFEPSLKERQLPNAPLSTVQQRTFQVEPSFKERQLPNATSSTVQQRTFQVEPSFKERQLPNAPLSTVQQRTFQFEPSLKGRQLPNASLSTVQQRTFQFEPSLKGRQLPNAPLSTVQQRTFQVEPSLKGRQLPNATLSTMQQRTFQVEPSVVGGESPSAVQRSALPEHFSQPEPMLAAKSLMQDLIQNTSSDLMHGRYLSGIIWEEIQKHLEKHPHYPPLEEVEEEEEEEEDDDDDDDDGADGDDDDDDYDDHYDGDEDEIRFLVKLEKMDAAIADLRDLVWKHFGTGTREESKKKERKEEIERKQQEEMLKKQEEEMEREIERKQQEEMLKKLTEEMERVIDEEKLRKQQEEMLKKLKEEIEKEQEEDSEEDQNDDDEDVSHYDSEKDYLNPLDIFPGVGSDESGVVEEDLPNVPFENSPYPANGSVYEPEYHIPGYPTGLTDVHEPDSPKEIYEVPIHPVYPTGLTYDDFLSHDASEKFYEDPKHPGYPTDPTDVYERDSSNVITEPHNLDSLEKSFTDPTHPLYPLHGLIYEPEPYPGHTPSGGQKYPLEETFPESGREINTMEATPGLHSGPSHNQEPGPVDNGPGHHPPGFFYSPKPPGDPHLELMASQLQNKTKAQMKKILLDRHNAQPLYRQKMYLYDVDH